MEWYALIFVAIVIEALITYAKTFVVDKKIQWQVIASVALGVLCAIAFKVDLFEIGGITSTIPYFGMVLTGVLMSRGSNYLYDVIKKITSIATSPASTNVIVSK